jgi:hypothetical protein
VAIVSALSEWVEAIIAGGLGTPALNFPVPMHERRVEAWTYLAAAEGQRWRTKLEAFAAECQRAAPHLVQDIEMALDRLRACPAGIASVDGMAAGTAGTNGNGGNGGGGGDDDDGAQGPGVLVDNSLPPMGSFLPSSGAVCAGVCAITHRAIYARAVPLGGGRVASLSEAIMWHSRIPYSPLVNGERFNPY